MLNEPTRDKLRALRLNAMATAWSAQHQQSQFAARGFDERFGLLVEAQWLYRENQRRTRLLKDAKLKMSQATVEDIDFPARRELDRAVVRQLATCRWVQEHQNLLISGATGTGKTFVACAFAQLACRFGYRVLYRRASRLFDELTLAHADGTYPRLLGRLARLDVLVIDDFGLAPLDEQQRRDLHEILDDRYGLRSTIIASQLLTKQWHAHIGDLTLADAICDRLFHNAHKLVLKGPSRRKPEGAD